MTKVFIAIAVVFVLFCCTVASSGGGNTNCDKRENPNPKVRSGLGPWVYKRSASNGPARWGKIDCPGFKTCGEGKLQSPINLNFKKTKFLSNKNGPRIIPRVVKLKYESTVNNFEFLCEGNECSELVFGKTFKLDNIHFHLPSEHTVRGRRAPMEAHLVHKTNGDAAVLAVFITYGRFNPQFQNLLNTAQRRGETELSIFRFLRPVIRARSFCTWKGSLTTPPCTEGIQWVVSLRTISVSPKQMFRFFKFVGRKITNRPVQRRNARPITCYVKFKRRNGRERD